MARRTLRKDPTWRPALIYVAVVAVLGLGLAAWQYRYEQSRRPPPADVIAKNLTEAFVGEGTVRATRLVQDAVEFWVAMDGVKALPKDRKTWKPFFTDVTDMIAERLFQLAPQLPYPELRALRTVRVRYTLSGKEIALGQRARADRQASVRMVEP